MLMNILQKFQHRFQGLSKAFIRFPLTGISFFISTIITILMISSNSDDYSKLVMTLIVSGFLFLISDITYERFFDKATTRILLYGISVVLAVLYYFTLRENFNSSVEVFIRTGIIMFALFIAFILIPSIKSDVTFNESFIITFKAFFISFFYSLILYLGMSIIILTIDNLLFDISSKLFAYLASIIFMFFAPMYLLSIIPVYIRKIDELSEVKGEKLKEIFRLSMIDKYLEILISYIIIPLTSIFTVILLLYIIKNIGGSFFTNSLLEPMIVSYSITVIIVYLLSSTLSNRFAFLYRLIFPKILIPIVLLQIISSIMSIGDMGITHGRYFVILYGLFSIITGVIFSVLPVRKNGYVAALLILFSIISILPPVDAFHVSINSQVRVLEETLTKNDMLKNNEIVRKDTLEQEDKKKIANATRYLYERDALNKVKFLPTIEGYPDINKVYGFDEYEYNDEYQYVNIVLKSNSSINVTEYDVFLDTYLNLFDKNENSSFISEFNHNGASYKVSKVSDGIKSDLVLLDPNNLELIRMSEDEIINHFENYSSEYNELTSDEATITKENDKVKLSIVVKNLFYSSTENEKQFKEMNCYIIIELK